MKEKTNHQHYSHKRLLAALLTVVMLFSLMPTAFAAQENGYHDPAEHWLTANNRTNELDANAVVTRETFNCGECGKPTSFEVFRTPEYTRNGQTAMTRNVKYSNGMSADGETLGTILDGTPGVDAYYTGYHWTKAVCENCGSLNTNMGKNDYGYLKNVYWLYDCAAEFMEDLPETVSYEYTDSKYHTVITKGGEYCCFCYGTNHETSSRLERHDLETDILPQPANGRFAVVDHCTLCDYQKYEYITAKSVVANYYGVVDGLPHTLTVTDLSEAGVRTQIRYGFSADTCTLTSAPNYTEEGQYTVYYEITYTYDGVDMTENGVAYVWLRDTQPSEDGSCGCGCGDPNCGCQDKDCDGNCCSDKGCGEDHHFILLDSTPATCLSLGYDRYLCTECGKIEKRNYVDSLGHAWQGVVVRDATCETDGKLLEICSRCGQVKVTATPKSEHDFVTYTVAATCTSPGYTVRECENCGERHIEDITPALPHNYEAHTIPASCETGGRTIHLCEGCGSSFVTDYTDSLGHSWDEGTLITNATCTGEGVMEYRCVRCGYHRLEGDAANGHVPGDPATCTQPQLCTKCGAVIENALGHDYKGEVTAPTCTEMGYTTYTCSRCGDTYKGDYTDAAGHKPGDWIIDKEPTTSSEGSKHKECETCGEKLETEAIEKLYDQATTDSKGEAVVGGYLVIVTDTDIDYVLNGDKTDGRILTAHFNCDPGREYRQMMVTKKAVGKPDQRQCYHIVQSFKPGEITPELAIEIAKEFAKEHLPGYEVVIGTHVDRHHIHSHILFNSVNADTGEKYHSTQQSYYQQIRAISDRLCREHGLSVIMSGEPAKAVSYIEWLRQSKGQPTFRSMLVADLREAIEDANDIGHFFLLMEHKGYEIHHGNRLGFRLRGQERFMYPERKDRRFSEDGIRAAIAGNLEAIEEGKRPAVISRPGYRPYRKHPKYTGFLALYVHYLYLLGKIGQRQYPPRMTPHLRKAAMEFDAYREQFAFLRENGITTPADMDAFQTRTEETLAKLMKQRTILNVRKKECRSLYTALADADALAPSKALYQDGLTGMEYEFEKYMEAVTLLESCGIPRDRLTAEKAELYEQLAELNREIRTQRQKLKLCKEIRQGLPQMEQDIERTETRESEVKRDEHWRR